jgi:hypothetical protein
MFLVLVEGGWSAASIVDRSWLTTLYPTLPFIAMKTADDHLVPWFASQTDILSSDWTVVSRAVARRHPTKRLDK